MTTNERMVQPKDPEVQDAQFFAAIGYLSFLCFVPLALKKDNKFAVFHGKQALVLFILEVAAFILKVVPVLGDLICTLGVVVFGILSLVGIVKVLMGERWEIPVVSEIADVIAGRFSSIMSAAFRDQGSVGRASGARRATANCTHRPRSRCT